MQNHVKSARLLREKMLRDPWRPRYHFVPPEGFLNDVNGLCFHNGRYHVFYLGRSPVPDKNSGGGETWVETWDHVSSRDLLHWVMHPAALLPDAAGGTSHGIWSGDAAENAPRPTMIYYVPAQGVCIAVSDDPDLNEWTPIPGNPVLPEVQANENPYVVFDPCAWYDNGCYYALIGNRNKTAGYTPGDSTSLFRSTDLRRWDYIGPFYKSDRRCTEKSVDCACPDFFPFGNRYILLAHSHRPVFHAHYYLGH